MNPLYNELRILSIEGKFFMRIGDWLTLIEYVEVNCSRDEIRSFWAAVLFPILKQVIVESSLTYKFTKFTFSRCLYLLLDETRGIRGKVELYYIRGSFLHRVADLSQSHDPAKVAEEVIMAGLTDMAVAGGDFS